MLSFSTPVKLTDANDRYLYIAGTDQGLIIADVSDPVSGVRLISHNTGGTAEAVLVSGNLAYVANAESLAIIDLSRPNNPETTGSVQLNGLSATNLRVVGGYAYISGNETGLMIVDVSDPSNPELLSTVDDIKFIRDVDIKGDTAYLVHKYGSVYLVDVSDPRSPVSLGFKYLESSSYAIIVNGTYAYVSNASHGMKVLDISDPASPVVVGGFNENFLGVEEMKFKDDYAYITGTSYYRTFTIMNVSNPFYPKPVYFDGGEQHYLGIDIKGDSVYSGGYWLKRYIVTDPLHPEIDNLGNHGRGTDFTGLAIKGCYLYAIRRYSHGYSRGMTVYDISDPERAVTVKEDIDCDDGRIIIHGDYAFVPSKDRGLQIFDISNPADPALVSFDGYELQVTNDAAFRGHYAYVTSGIYITNKEVVRNQGLRVYDISNIRQPVLKKVINLKGGGTLVSIRDHYAFVGSNEDGCRIYDISSPESPRLVWILFPGKTAKRTAFYGNYAYIEADNKVHVFRMGENPLTLIQPDSGGIWETGSIREIKWDASNYSGDVDIELFKSNLKYIVIDKGIPASDGSYSWTVGSYADGFVKPGDRFKIGVRAVDGRYLAISRDSFSISSGLTFSLEANPLEIKSLMQKRIIVRLNFTVEKDKLHMNIVKYRVMRKADDENGFKSIAEFDDHSGLNASAAHRFDDFGVIPGKTYTYYIEAVNPNGHVIDQSDEKQVKIEF